MRDIREDLRERLREADLQVAHLRQQLAKAEEARDSIATLIGFEMQRWKTSAEDEAFPRQDKIPGLELGQLIEELLSTGEEWSTHAIAAVAARRGVDFGTSSPGRSVHFTMLNLLRSGKVEQSKSGNWASRKSTEPKEDAAEEATEGKVVTQLRKVKDLTSSA
ncbi:MAG: hypothetical protein U0R19_19130 [Bryobacteraceae bacterium]